MPPPTITINPSRLNRTLAELGGIGETAQGMQRLAYSPADVAGRQYAMSLMRQAGLDVRIDPAGNIIGRKPGSGFESRFESRSESRSESRIESRSDSDSRSGFNPDLPAIALGSHTDTVPNGGKYDGALGVMAAIEVVQTLADNNHALRHPVEVVIFTNEEGTRFHRWLLGSRAMAGLLEPEDYTAVDEEGVSLATRLAYVGGDLARIDEARRYPAELAAYFELHIEQGPTLHQTDTPIGVVTGITGRAVFSVTVQGKANHAGTTPMGDRHDALVAASHLVLAAQRLATESEICRVATVGNLQVRPNAVNVVPGEVSMGVELRDLDANALSAAETVFRRSAIEIAEVNRVSVAINKLETTPAVPLPAQLQEMVAEAAQQSGLVHSTLPSGAGHDAQAIAAITPAGMIFVPSIDGISHAPQEFTPPEDCANGAQVLLNLVLLADARF